MFKKSSNNNMPSSEPANIVEALGRELGDDSFRMKHANSFCLISNGRRQPGNAWYRRHGFSPPLDYLLIIQWLTLFILYLGFNFLAQFTGSWRTGLFILFHILGSIIIFLSIRTSLVDTMDPNVAKAHQPRDLDYTMQLGISVVDPYNGHCNVCQVVVDLSTRHCKSCNKCVSGQDHHCRWLNTCIGRANYRPFYYLISTSFLTILGYVCLSIYVVYLAVARNNEFSEIVISWGVERSNVFRYVGACFLVLILSWVTFGSLTQLIVFHTKLYFLDMTTWEWINRDGYFVDRDNPWKQAPPRNIFTLLRLPYDECKYSIQYLRQKTTGPDTEEEEFLPMTIM